jgi:CubicO group peptidase (beta-lactamase class C family)
MNKPLSITPHTITVSTTQVEPSSAYAKLPSKSTAGFSERRLLTLTNAIQLDIHAGRIPGAAMLIARDGVVVHECALGAQDPERGTPMMLDSIFRIYSMTKPIVSVAVMMMVEEGKLLISDPVSKYLPELRDLKVGIEKRGSDGRPMLELVPATREMTVQDLLRHTSGLTYSIFGVSLVKQAYIDAGVESRPSNDKLIKRLATVPLAYHPGTVWEYSRSTDVLGVLLERMSGTTLDVHLKQRIFDPLNMTDTGFWVDPSRHHRIAEPFAVSTATGKQVRLLNVKSRPDFLAGGGGLVSTLHDYYRFTQMLLNEGELDGARLLSRKTLQHMTSDHLRGIPSATSGDYLPGPGHGFGLGFAVRTSDGGAITAGTVGEYSWSGLAGTLFWVDPQEKMIAIFMVQAPEYLDHYKALFRNLVYAAME